MIELTKFRNILDVNASQKHQSFDDWKDFRKELLRLHKLRGYKPTKEELVTHKAPRHNSPLITPAVYKGEQSRKNENVTYWGRWAALDVDDYKETFDEVAHQFSEYNCVFYSSASSRKSHPKFRVVFELDDIVPKDNIKHFWNSLNKEFGYVNDPQTKDLSRMYYVPAQYDNAFNFFFKNDGKLISVRGLMDKHKYVAQESGVMSDNMPDSIKEQLEKMKRESLYNGKSHIKWTSYKDCPFIDKRMLYHYQSIAYTDNSGRYRYMFKIMLSIAGSATFRDYPITPEEIEALCREIDRDNGHRYKHRNMYEEAQNAITYALKKTAFSLAS